MLHSYVSRVPQRENSALTERVDLNTRIKTHTSPLGFQGESKLLDCRISVVNMKRTGEIL